MPDTHVQRVGSLEIDQDLDFQRRSWIVQRVGWGVIGVALIAAMLGVFGSGPLSYTSVRDPQGPLILRYSRLTRYQAPTTLELQIGHGAARAETVRVWFTTAYLRAVQLQHVTPQPERVEGGGERTTFVFRLSSPGQSAVVFFHFQPEQVGSLAGQVGVESNPPLSFSQFVYP